MIRRFLGLPQAERDAIYEHESNAVVSAAAQQHCAAAAADRLAVVAGDNALVRGGWGTLDAHTHLYVYRVDTHADTRTR